MPEVSVSQQAWLCPERWLSNYPRFLTGPRRRGRGHIQTVAINTLINLHTQIQPYPGGSSQVLSLTLMYTKFGRRIKHETRSVSAYASTS